MNQDKELIKQKNAIRFIEATQELIDTEGISGISIRKIAGKAGFHNSTIYLYFKDVDELILLASLKHFNEYSASLASLSKHADPPRKTFVAVWRFFAYSVFQEPEIFYNFFFGKHRGNLTEIFEKYYSLFPEEQEIYSEEIHGMYYGSDIYERCMLLMQPLIDGDSRITGENADMINDIIVCYLRSLLEKKCDHPEIEAAEISEQLVQAIEFLVF